LCRSRGRPRGKGRGAVKTLKLVAAGLVVSVATASPSAVVSAHDDGAMREKDSGRTNW
jgi:hypothetical protein